MSQLSFNAFSGLGAGSMGLTYPELIAMQAAYGKQGLTHADMAATAAQVMAAQAPAAVPPPVAAAPTAAAVLAPVATSIAPQPSGGPAPWGSQDPKSWLRGKDLPGRRGGGRRRGRGFGRKRHRGGRNRHEIRDRHKQAAAYMAQQCQSQLAAVKQAKQALRSCKQNARSGSMSGLGLSFSPENRDKTAAYLIGAGTVGVLAGFGLGSKEPNKLMLMVGFASLIYGNYLSPVIEISAREEVIQTVTDVRRRIPFVGGGSTDPRVRGSVQVGDRRATFEVSP